MSKAARQSAKTAPRINGLKIDQDSKGVHPRTSEHDSAEIVEQKPLEGRLEQRRWRRRRDISCLDGLIREHGRLIAAIHNGRIELTKAEVLSRAYGRHREMVTALEQRDQLQAIQEQLATLRGESAGLPRLASDIHAEAMS